MRKFDAEFGRWKSRDMRDGAVIVVLDAVRLKGVIPYLKAVKSVLFAYAAYPKHWILN